MNSFLLKPSDSRLWVRIKKVPDENLPKWSRACPVGRVDQYYPVIPRRVPPAFPSLPVDTKHHHSLPRPSAPNTIKSFRPTSPMKSDPTESCSKISHPPPLSHPPIIDIQPSPKFQHVVPSNPFAQHSRSCPIIFQNNPFPTQSKI
jgi:hypothetical protein